MSPIYFGARRCSRADLDRVSCTRPVGVMHAGGHVLNANTAVLGEDDLATLQRLTAEADYPVRIVSLLRLIGMKPADAVARAVALAGRSSERLGSIKVVADGSIQGFSARLPWPGYYNGAPNGLWYLAPEAMRETCTLALQAGVQVHTHTNGDEATALVLDCPAPPEIARERPGPTFKVTIGQFVAPQGLTLTRPGGHHAPDA